MVQDRGGINCRIPRGIRQWNPLVENAFVKPYFDTFGMLYCVQFTNLVFFLFLRTILRTTLYSANRVSVFAELLYLVRRIQAYMNMRKMNKCTFLESFSSVSGDLCLLNSKVLCCMELTNSNSYFTPCPTPYSHTLLIIWL